MFPSSKFVALLIDVICDKSDHEGSVVDAQGVLKKVDCSNWTPHVVVVAKKNGSVRICADFKTGLNEAIEMHEIPCRQPMKSLLV